MQKLCLIRSMNIFHIKKKTGWKDMISALSICPGFVTRYLIKAIEGSDYFGSQFDNAHLWYTCLGPAVVLHLLLPPLRMSRYHCTSGWKKEVEFRVSGVWRIPVCLGVSDSSEGEALCSGLNRFGSYR